jgi:orotate phosphoribosyltransferase
MVNQQLLIDFAVRISKIQAFQDITTSPGGNGFKLKLHDKNPGAPLSPFYLNYRLLQSDYDAKQMGVSLFEQMLEDLRVPPVRLAPVPEAIIPLVSSLSDRTRIPMITPRTAKTHGSGSTIDGIWHRGLDAALFDDVLTSGESVATAFETLKAGGVIVRDVFVLTDRQQGGRDRLARLGLTVHAVFTLTALLFTLRSQGLLEEKVLLQIQEYRELTASA